MSFPVLAGARAGAGLEPAPDPAPGAGAAGAGAAAAADSCACSRLTGAPILSPSQSWSSSARIMMSLGTVSDKACSENSGNSLSALYGVCNELSELDDGILVEGFIVHI